MILVVAGKRQEYNDFLRYMKGRDRQKFRYVHEPEHIMGWDYRITQIIRIGTYWLNPLYRSGVLHMVMETIDVFRPGEIYIKPMDMKRLLKGEDMQQQDKGGGE